MKNSSGCPTCLYPPLPRLVENNLILDLWLLFLNSLFEALEVWGVDHPHGSKGTFLFPAPSTSFDPSPGEPCPFSSWLSPFDVPSSLRLGPVVALAEWELLGVVCT